MFIKTGWLHVVWAGLLVWVLHICLSIWIAVASGFTYIPISSLWQVAPLELLKNDLFGTLWHWQVQPPLFNLFIGLLAKISIVWLPVVQHGIQIVLAGSVAAMALWIVWLVTRCAQIAFVAGVLVMLNPSLVLFAAYPLYDVITAWLVMLSCLWMAVFAAQKERKNIWPIHLCAVTLVLLMMVRSLYHLVLLVPVAVLVCLMVGRRWKSVLLCLLLIFLPVFGWYVKNQMQFGYWGTSSGIGLSFSKIATMGWSKAELAILEREGKISPVVAAYPICYPLIMDASLYRVFGYIREGNHPVLNYENMNNINFIKISDDYKKSCIELIKANPYRYVRNVALSYSLYTNPCAQNTWLNNNGNRVAWYRDTYCRWILGGWMGETIKKVTGRAVVPSYMTFLVAGLTIYGCVWLLTVCAGGWKSGFEKIVLNGSVVFMIGLISYTAIISNLFECGEQSRYAFYTENIVILCVLILLYEYKKKRMVR